MPAEMDSSEGDDRETPPAIAIPSKNSDSDPNAANSVSESSVSGFQNNSGSKTPASNGTLLTTDRAREEVGRLLNNAILSKVDCDAIDILLKDYDSLREKTTKLKSLLGRSAKAQREAKVDLDASQKRLDHANREIERLNKKIDKFANRPTHMELLADFETNFDRALLSFGQSGGQDTAQPVSPNDADIDIDNSAVVDALLMQELSESKQRIEKLESLNAVLVHRSSQMESEAKERKRDRDELMRQVAHLELEKRMAVMEAEDATKAMQEKAASLAEMQMEIELVTKASVNANVRAAQGEEIIKTVKTDKQYVQELESRVQALQEWALASSESKTLAQERVRLLESQLKVLQRNRTPLSDDASPNERILWFRKGALVVGAGDVGARVVGIGEEFAEKLRPSERVVLRWQFDLTGDDLDIFFSILKGRCETATTRKNADILARVRKVKGGAAGELENAFDVAGSCTLLWSNMKSWIRPKTIKYSLEAVALAD
jgi:hypothetical protein